MFYDNYLRLCNQKGVSASGAALEMGLSRAAVTGWAQGKVPRDATLRRIADYFGGSVEELTRDQKEKPAEDDEPQTLEEAREVLRQSGIRVLLDAEGDDFTPEEIKEIMNFIKFKHEQRGKQN